MTISFGSGLIKVGNEYINTDRVESFRGDNKKAQTYIRLSRSEYGSHISLPDVQVKDFADAFIKAQKTGDIIDVNKIKTN